MNERQNKLLTLLEEHGEVSVEELTKQLGSSEATIRRDLTSLENDGKLARTFGGAKTSIKPSLVIERFEKKREKMRVEKEHIAHKAAEFVEPGMIIAIDSGTTTWRLAAALKEKGPLTVITSAMAVIEELGAIEGLSIFCTGGKFRQDNLDFIGASTISSFSKLHADIAFLGADSIIPGKGVFSLDEASADVSRAIVASSDKRVILADHSKINSSGCYLVAQSGEIDYLITDSKLDEDIKNNLKHEKFELIITS
jgi:DeoR/GlpR family transcriptional regulator of sugar metabolism